ncbi:MAG: GNAT family N-acetyltransferase [Rhizobiaceae bacterium]
MSVFIRSANDKDLTEVQSLLRRAWHTAYDAIHGAEKVTAITLDWHSLANLKANLARPWSEFLVADTGEKLLGMAYARQSSEDFVMLYQLYVEPDCTGQGIGAQLLDECFEAFPEAKAFRLEVDEQNPKAVRFYERFGFKEIARTANCGQDGSEMPAIVMERRA